MYFAVSDARKKKVSAVLFKFWASVAQIVSFQFSVHRFKSCLNNCPKYLVLSCASLLKWDLRNIVSVIDYSGIQCLHLSVG